MADQTPSTNLSLMGWIASIFFGFIPGLVLLLVKKDDAFIQAQSKEMLNWSISVMAGYLVVVVAAVIVPTVTDLFLLVWLAHVIFCVMGAVFTAKGADYKVPLAIRLIN